MNSKTLISLVIALAVLVLAARYLNRPKSAETAYATSVLGFDLGAAEKIVVSHDTQSVSIAHVDGTWVVQNLWNYPADFELITENMRKLAGLKGEIIRGGENQLADFGLTPSNVDYVAISFADGSGKELGKIELGSPRLSGAGEMGSYPNGQYVRSGGGSVILVSEFLGGIPRRPEDWLAKQLFNNLDARDIAYITIGIHGSKAYELSSGAGSTWTLSDLAAGEVMNQDSARNVANALGHLSLVTIADPATPIADENSFTAQFTNGIVYSVKTGEFVQETSSRYASVSIFYNGADTNSAARAAQENKKYAGRIFVLPDEASLNLIKPRAELVQLVTNAAPAATTPSPP